ncbi:MFS transporter [Paraglaciecola chathamensis]|uniref:MFS transporter n=1 Tax=Paraglaciecola chathamensis TaxID=368405 RepID=A0ABS0WH52_9ALTE|nr:MFS transporter [Paraglaciecola chathamensis]MBJ2137778.1 MFS transporter [Paraglaciecola chathamensis]
MSQLSRIAGFTLLVISSLTIMVGTVVAPGLHGVANALGIDHFATWLITLPALGAVIFAPFAGRIIDKFGAYYALLFGLALYGLLGAGGIFLHGPYFVFADRILLGAATAIVMAGGTTLISQWYEGHKRLAMIAKQGMAIELGGVIFLFIGGQLALEGWQMPFGLYLIAWVCLALMLLFIPKKSPKTSDDGHSQKDEKRPATSLKLVYLMSVLSMVLFFIAIAVLPMSMASTGFSEDEIGFFLAFISLIAVVGALIMPKLVIKLPEKVVLILATCMFALTHFTFFNAETLQLLILGGVFCGLGFGFSIPLLNHMVVEQSHPQYRGRNLSYFTMAVFLGQFLTSFVELIPGERSTVYAVAGIAALIIACLLIAQRVVSLRQPISQR